MNLSQLYYFRKLAELQHYTRAAKELFITQPTLSGSISTLEQELGVSLFQKAGRNVELTKYGAEFLTYVNASLEQLDKGVAIMKGYSGEGDGGVIELGCIITLQTDYIPRLLKAYAQSTEHSTEFDISQKSSQELLAGIAEGKHDVVFCACDDVEGEDLEFIPVVEQQLVVAMNAYCSLASAPFLTIEDLRDKQLITYRGEMPIGKAVKRLLEGHGIENVRYAYEDESILSGFAAEGPEIALLLNTFLPLSTKDLVVKPLYDSVEDKRRYFHTVYLGFSEKHYRPYCVDHFIDYVRDHQLDRSSCDIIYID